MYQVGTGGLGGRGNGFDGLGCTLIGKAKTLHGRSVWRSAGMQALPRPGNVRTSALSTNPTHHSDILVVATGKTYIPSLGEELENDT